jgi:hypothetical protein
MIEHRYFINKFPKIELSYDQLLHRKIHSDLYILIPQGNKVFIWFTFYQNQNICVIMHVNKYNIITKVEETCMCFDKSLAYGTILYGTCFNYNNMKFISCENICHYKGDDINDKLFIDKFKIMKKIFHNELQQKAYTKDFAILGLPYITDNLHKAFEEIKFIPYPINSIQFRNWKNNKSEGMMINKETKTNECIFKIKANIEQDIYDLYCKGYNGDMDLYGNACITDYKTSVMMNNHFRFIKENLRLDRLEESDDEEEFENINDDKFVNLKKIVYMKCIYMKKFRKWKPIECVKFGENLLTKRDIQKLEYS